VHTFFTMGSSLVKRHGSRSNVTRDSSFRSMRKPWLIFAAIAACAMLSISFVVASEDATEPKKTRAWTLFHRLLMTGGSESGSAVPQESSLNWNVRGMMHLTAASTDNSAEMDVSELAEIPESLVRDIQTLDGLGGGKSWYQLKLVPDGTTDEEAMMVLTSVPACHVVRAKFRDELQVHLQPTTGHALSLTYMPLISPWAPTSCADMEVNMTAPLQWDTKVSWDTATPGMVVGLPPLIDPITKVAVGGVGNKIKPPPGILWSPNAIPKKTNAGGEEDANSDKADPFAFFKRYWYIFLPMLLMNLMAAGQPQEAPSGGAAAATVARAVAPGAEGNARQRRGKKD
jgi:hypothetical protein